MNVKRWKHHGYSFFLTLFGLTLFGFADTIHAQNIVITGTVTESSNSSPLPGVTITIKGDETKGTQTDFDGKYTIEVTDTKTTLVYRYLGFTTKEQLVGNQSVINVSLEEDSQALDEIIVVGYGTQKKSDVTGAISTIKTEDLNNVVVTNPIDAIQGRVSGVNVVSSSGSPGGIADISIRGTATFGDNKPLYIVDGVQSDPYFIDPNNIESMEILKDAASSAIYGTRAANGVIIITTKKGDAQKTSVEINSSVSINTLRNEMKLLDADGYIKVHRQIYENAGEALPSYVETPPNVNTNWIDETHRDGILNLLNARITGGTENLNYSIGGNFADEKGVLIGSSFTKKGLNLNLGTSKGKFKIGAAINYTETRREEHKFSIRETYFISPLIPVRDTTKESGFGYNDGDLPGHRNPVGDDHFLNEYTKLNYFLGNLDFGYEIIKNLNINANFSLATTNNFTYEFHQPFRVTQKEDDDDRFAMVSEYNSQFRRINQHYTLNYNFELNKHKIGLLAGYQRINEPFRRSTAQADGYKLDENDDRIPATILDPSFNTLDAFEDGTYSAEGTNFVYNIVSQFGRINYAFDDKYLLQASIRRDGTSKFGENNKYGNFPSFALGWKITDENFMKNQNIFDFLKMRYSWGQAGNDAALDYYDFIAVISQGKSQNNGGYVFGNPQISQLGSIARTLPNPDLQWETTTSSNFGIDFSSLKNRLKGAVNYYHGKTKNLLITKEFTTSAGVEDDIVNAGEFINKGLEFEIGYTNRDREFKYAAFATFTTTNTEVTKLSNNEQVLRGIGLLFGSDHFVNQTKVGYEPGAYFLPVADGIFQNQAEIDAHGAQTDTAQPGDIRFVDQNNDGIIDEQDEVYMGSAIPKYEYSLNLSAEYKGFDLNVFLQGVGNNKIYNGNDFRLMSLDTGRNYREDALNAWTPSNTNTNVPRAVLGDPNGNNRASTRFLEDGDYLRVKTIQLGYSINPNLLKKIHFNKIRVYVTGQNLFTITNYNGLDPEVGGNNSDLRVGERVLSRGIDRNLYPKYKSMIFGIQVGF